MATNDGTLDLFLDILSQGSDYKNLNKLMSQVFCANVGSPPTAPWVGIANYGPQFVGVDAIRTLFSQIFFVTFPDVQFQPISNTYRLYSSQGPDTIAIQAMLSGTQVGFWFQHPSLGFSPPISGITPSGKKMNVAACAVFTFNNGHRVSQLSIYFDRYLMSQQLA